MFSRVFRRSSLISACVFTVITLICQFATIDDAVAQRGGRGGGGRAGGGRAGGGARAARPSTRPGPSTRPAPSTRPSTGGAAQRPAQRPSGGGIQGGSGDISGRPDRGDVNIDRGDINIDRDVDVDVDGGWGWDDDWWYWGAAVGTAIVVGSIVSDIPEDECSEVLISGTTYQSCNGVLYQPVYQGTTVQYQVVETP